MKLQFRDSKTGEMVTLDAGIAHLVSTGVMDANEGVFFQRQLEYIKAKSYDVMYADLQARNLFPVSNEAGPGVTSITYRTYDQTGMAKIISAYAKDLPRADISGKETTIPVRSVGISYGYNLDEIQSAQLVGMPLDQRRANAAMRANEQVVNDVAFNGDAEHGLPGFLSNPNIPAGNVPNGAGGTPEWTTKTPAEILFDINDIFADIFETTFMKESANTLLLPVAQWSYITTTARSTTSDTTIAEYVVRNSPFLTSIDNIIPVNELAAAGAGGGDIMVAYNRDPDKLQLEIPVELEWRPVQEKGLEFIVPGRSRLGGVNVYYPLSASIMEDI